ncbi:YicC/YloC family endoribonuclease [Alteribacillus iranensis]|uniref:TIGR00255 family protein n=1 Tax=Alteribacillus iranensis TaxID=930128 RepID=A0A1I2A9H7_9BACI|nr:YicC/YloC family endoribonuclease [Alteribacillus iranensis]SFE40238.1 TIGR00255 family protein [Alteribacillus iranensis]
MTVSMTGFGHAQSQYKDGRIIVEIKSVNHRFCDIQFRMPRQLMMLEEQLQTLVRKKVARGKVDVFISLEGISPSTKRTSVDRELLHHYLDEADQLEQYNLFDPRLSLQEFLFHPDIVTVEEETKMAQDCMDEIKAAVQLAVDQLFEMRLAEGKKLFEDIIQRIDMIRGLTANIERQAPKVVDYYMNRLHQRIAELLDGRYELEQERVLTETAVFADKINVEEEITRMYAHCDQFISIMEDRGAKGRKLDFLVQEMNREANTIGAKANDATLSHLVVEVKSELEKIKEQVQNIE